MWVQAQDNLHTGQRANADSVQREHTVYVNTSMEEVAFNDTDCNIWKGNSLEVVQQERILHRYSKNGRLRKL